MTYEPRWDRDRPYGEDGERFIDELLSGRRRWEIKRKRRMDGWLYVELEQDPGATGNAWKPSGLATTEADYWIYVVAHTGIVAWLPVDLLRWAVSEGYGKTAEERDGGNPTRGRLLRFDALIQQAKDWLGAGGVV